MRDLISLLIGFIYACFAYAQAIVGGEITLNDISIAGTTDSVRVTIWTNSELSTQTFLLSDPDINQQRSGPLFLVIGADSNLGDLTNTLSQPVLSLLARQAGIRSWSSINGDLWLELSQPLKPTRTMSLKPIGDEVLYRTIIDFEVVSPEHAQALIAQQTLAYSAHIESRKKIHVAMAQTQSTAPKAHETPSQLPLGNARVAPAKQKTQTVQRTNPPAPSPPDADIININRYIPPPAQLSPKKSMPPYTIVIDPGHGGHDPGAVKHSEIEKTIVLQAALELKVLLESNSNYIVKTTRNTDKFISLADRVALARQWKADLFISVHADSVKQSYLQGASVYTLSERGLKRSKSFAEEEDWALPDDISGQDSQVANILSDFAQRETVTMSAKFADILIKELRPVTKLVRNSHRNAGYVVLFASDVPAVLLEMGFLSNAADAKRLSTQSGRRPVLHATRKAIDRYFENAQSD